MENEMFYLNDAAIETLVTAILNKVNQRISQRIVQTVDSSSDGTHTPSALAVYQLISKINHASMVAITGPLPDDAKENTIYLQRNTKSDPNWNMYTLLNDTWVHLGSTDINLDDYFSKTKPEDIEDLKVKINLANYWSKEDTDVTALRALLNIPEVPEIKPVTTEMITAAVDKAFAATDPVS